MGLRRSGGQRAQLQQHEPQGAHGPDRAPGCSLRRLCALEPSGRAELARPPAPRGGTCLLRSAPGHGATLPPSAPGPAPAGRARPPGRCESLPSHPAGLVLIEDPAPSSLHAAPRVQFNPWAREEPLCRLPARGTAATFHRSSLLGTLSYSPRHPLLSRGSGWRNEAEAASRGAVVAQHVAPPLQEASSAGSPGALAWASRLSARGCWQSLARLVLGRLSPSARLGRDRATAGPSLPGGWAGRCLKGPVLEPQKLQGKVFP